MSDSTRRGFLGIAGAGAVAAGAAAVAPAAFAEDTEARTPPEGSADEPVVAYVSNARKGELSLMAGEREVVLHDRALVNRILNAARR
ncbi:MAG TPA: hypothetical protein VFD59_21170 [Nocardioidaceae bacterium]|nr:hypothetical protein [Nocardioidaceae bacterium]